MRENNSYCSWVCASALIRNSCLSATAVTRNSSDPVCSTRYLPEERVTGVPLIVGKWMARLRTTLGAAAWRTKGLAKTDNTDSTQSQIIRGHGLSWTRFFKGAPFCVLWLLPQKRSNRNTLRDFFGLCHRENKGKKWISLGVVPHSRPVDWCGDYYLGFPFGIWKCTRSSKSSVRILKFTATEFLAAHMIPTINVANMNTVYVCCLIRRNLLHAKYGLNAMCIRAMSLCVCDVLLSSHGLAVEKWWCHFESEAIHRPNRLFFRRGEKEDVRFLKADLSTPSSKCAANILAKCQNFRSEPEFCYEQVGWSRHHLTKANAWNWRRAVPGIGRFELINQNRPRLINSSHVTNWILHSRKAYWHELVHYWTFFPLVPENLTDKDLEDIAVTFCEISRDMGPGIKWLNTFIMENRMYCM